jgi:hypothetical protein
MIKQIIVRHGTGIGVCGITAISHSAKSMQRVELYHDPSNANVSLGPSVIDIFRIISIPKNTQTNEATDVDIVCRGGPCKCAPGHFLGELFILTIAIL